MFPEQLDRLTTSHHSAFCLWWQRDGLIARVILATSIPIVCRCGTKFDCQPILEAQLASEPTRTELQQLAEEALRDAQILLREGSWSFAYYLAGYAVELAIKACIAKTFKADTIPSKQRVLDIYQHKLSKLIGMAELGPDLQNQEQASQNFRAAWGVVNLWSPEDRYRVNSEQNARDLISAISDATHGVLPWIRQHW
jgi:hypothetical protein